MADETPVSPISAAEPPAVNPLETAATPHAATLKLNPVVRRPAVGAATATGLKPGLRLPPKPGLPTQGGLKPGLKLPPKPGLPTQGGLKPGLRLPPKPVIHKPGTVAAAKPVPKPIAKVDMSGVQKLPTVAAAPITHESAAVADLPASDAQTPMQTLKSVTQKLKGITQPIPVQAVLHKTGIISDAALPSGQSDEQRQAAKAKTSRISLSEAMGVAPVSRASMPMKTIRIKRPTDIPESLASGPKPVAPTAPAPAPAAPAAADAPTVAEDAPTVTGDATQATTPAAPATAPTTTVTQRKTLKIVRPGAVRPSGGKFGGVKKPSGSAAKTTAPRTADATAANETVADIPDLPSTPQAPVPTPVAAANDVPGFVAVLGVIVQCAACVAMGALAWYLFQDTQLPLYCGGCL